MVKSVQPPFAQHAQRRFFHGQVIADTGQRGTSDDNQEDHIRRNGDRRVDPGGDAVGVLNLLAGDTLLDALENLRVTALDAERQPDQPRVE